MGILPKYKVGSFAISYIFNPSEDKSIEKIFQVCERSVLWDGWKPEWSYTGKYYDVISANPLKLKYSTTGGIREKDFVPLELRLMIDNSDFEESKELEPVNPKLYERGLKLAAKKREDWYNQFQIQQA